VRKLKAIAEKFTTKLPTYRKYSFYVRVYKDMLDEDSIETARSMIHELSSLLDGSSQETVSSLNWWIEGSKIDLSNNIKSTIKRYRKYLSDMDSITVSYIVESNKGKVSKKLIL